MVVSGSMSLPIQIQQYESTDTYTEVYTADASTCVVVSGSMSTQYTYTHTAVYTAHVSTCMQVHISMRLQQRHGHTSVAAVASLCI